MPEKRRSRTSRAPGPRLQSANRALKPKRLLLSMTVRNGWWGAHEPYVPEKTAFAIRYHQCLRFFPDAEYGYEYLESYFRSFGEDYVPEPYLQETHKWVKNHKWYEYPRLVTVNDLYSFDRNAKVSIDPFREVIARHFKSPRKGSVGTTRQRPTCGAR